MSEPTVLVVGAGPAGLAAAVELARAGFAVRVVDQGRAPGGAVHRQPLPGAVAVALAAHRRRWRRLWADVAACGPAIAVTCETRLIGLDATGTALLTGAGAGVIRPRALVLATGAMERVLPRPGWTLPGVQTAGAIQTALKTTGQAPAGRIVLAGSGPLLLAVGAELVRLGNPPVAIVEAARPFRAGALALPLSYQREAARHLARLAWARVPLLTGARVERIAPGEASGEASGKATAWLRVSLGGRQGGREIVADLLGLHDGIRSADPGPPAAPPIPVVRAGDCREALGARAALADGRHAGRVLAARLAGRKVPDEPADLARERLAQARLTQLYAHDEPGTLAGLPDHTVLCRCEGRTLADLRALGPAPTVRDLRLIGRFGMGPCQGRFCGEWVARLGGTADLGHPRLPLRPVAIADLLALPVGAVSCDEGSLP